MTNVTSAKVPLNHIRDVEKMALESNLLDKMGKIKIFDRMS